MTQFLPRLREGVKSRVRRYLPEEPRLRRARLSTLGTIATRALNLGTRVLSVPLALYLLGPERYGVWLTLGALLAWLALADVGAQTALINPLAGAVARHDTAAARRLVSSAFAFLLSAGAAAFCGFTIVVLSVDLAGLFNVPDWVRGDLRLAVHVALAFTAVSIPLRLGRVVLVAHQREYGAVWADAGADLAALSAMALMYFTGASLTGFAAAVLGSVVAAQVLLWRRVFRTHAAGLSPDLRLADRGTVKALAGDGVWFLVTFLGDLLIMQTAPLVISNALDPSRATPYGVTFQLFYFPMFVIYSWVKPLWPAYADAAARGDADWIRRQHRRSLVQCVAAMAAVALVNVAFGRVIIRLWTGTDAAVPPLALLAVMGCFFPLWMWTAVNGNLLQAIGGVRARARIALLSGLINLTASLALVHRFGIVGVALGSLLGLAAVEGALMPLMVRRYLNRIRGGLEVKPAPVAADPLEPRAEPI